MAVDVDPIRLEDTRQNLQRLGVRSVELRCGDVSEPEFVSSLGLFDRILLDAPCSNVGVLRHNPEVKYRLGPHDPTKFAERQLRMLVGHRGWSETRRDFSLFGLYHHDGRNIWGPEPFSQQRAMATPWFPSIPPTCHPRNL